MKKDSLKVLTLIESCAPAILVLLKIYSEINSQVILLSERQETRQETRVLTSDHNTRGISWALGTSTIVSHAAWALGMTHYWCLITLVWKLPYIKVRTVLKSSDSQLSCEHKKKVILCRNSWENHIWSVSMKIHFYHCHITPTYSLLSHLLWLTNFVVKYIHVEAEHLFGVELSHFTQEEAENFSTLWLNTWTSIILKTSEIPVKKSQLNISKCFIYEAIIKHILEKIRSVYQAFYWFFRNIWST